MNTKCRVTFFLPYAVFQRSFLLDIDACMLSRFGCVQLFATLWTIALQAPQSMRFSREEYWSELPFLNPGGFPHPGMEPTSLTSPALAGRFFTTVPPGKPQSKSCLSKYGYCFFTDRKKAYRAQICEKPKY